ncbi:hypothetical protein GCM10022234_16140 [Aeromicrobium panaciterrae]
MPDDGFMGFKGRNGDQYVVDTSRLDRASEVAVCRATLELIAPDVDRFQCDVPWSREADWPTEVSQAASLLVPVHSGYQTSGWIQGFSDVIWRAFVAFAPYAYSADAWTAEMKLLGEVNDEGTSLTVRVLPEQLQQFGQSVHGADVVPLSKWRKGSRALGSP